MQVKRRSAGQRKTSELANAPLSPEWHSPQCSLPSTDAKGREEFVPEIVTDMQYPAAPVFRTRPRDEQAHHELGVCACVRKISDDGCAPIGQRSFGIGIVKVELGHELLPDWIVGKAILGPRPDTARLCAI